MNRLSWYQEQWIIHWVMLLKSNRISVTEYDRHIYEELRLIRSDFSREDARIYADKLAAHYII